MKSKLYIGFLGLAILLLSACGNNDNAHYKKDISDIPESDIEIKRYENVFTLEREYFFDSIAVLQLEYPAFFDGDISDTADLEKVWAFFDDPYLQELYRMVQKDYPDLSAFDTELGTAFRYLQYYFPDFQIPNIYTYVSGLDFQFPVKYTGEDLIISLDVFLPSGKEIYAQTKMPQYRLLRHNAKRIVPDAMDVFAKGIVAPMPSTPHLLDQMIYEGKVLYFIHAMIPDIHDSVLFNYSQSQEVWCQQNEANVWAFILENEFLYETKIPIINRFMKDGPFTSIFNKQSPSRIGSYLGYQIVLNYMMENDVEIDELLSIRNSQDILQASGYHPE